jgi:hypothetical protein
LPAVEDGEHHLHGYLGIARAGVDIIRRDQLQLGEGSRNDLFGQSFLHLI